MITLLPETDQRRLGILHLLSRQIGWLTVEEIASQIGASERTVQSDLNYMKKEWGTALSIEVSLKNGVRLSSHSSAAMQAVTVAMFKRSVAVQFLKEVILYPDQGLEFYRNLMFVSRSTLIRTLPTINSNLAETGGCIRQIGTRFRLVAKNEQTLRKLLAEFYLELSPEIMMRRRKDGDYFLPGASMPIDRTRLFDFAQRYIWQNVPSERADLFCLDDAVLAMVTSFVLISLLRENQGFHAKDAGILRGNLDDQDFRYLQQVFPAIERQHLTPVLCLLEQILLEPESAEEAEMLHREVARFYRSLFEQLHLTCDPETQQQLDRVLVMMYSYRKLFPVALSRFPRRMQFLASTLEQDHPALHQAIRTELQAFSERTRVDMSPMLSNLIVKVCYRFPNIARATVLKRVLVVSDSGRIHAEFLASFLKSLFNGSDFSTIEVTACDLEEYSAPSFQSSAPQYDILLTTLLPLPNLHLFETVIQIEDLPSRENLNVLSIAIYGGPATSAAKQPVD